MSWKDTLLDASFKGVTFDVIDDTLRGTHALAEHEYPFVQGADIEDTGVSAMDMALTAVLWGEDYEGRLQNLLNVLRETGAGELIHPIYGSVPDCVVADFEAAHNEENPDYCTVRMTFKQSVKAAPFFDRDLPTALTQGRHPRGRADCITQCRKNNAIPMQKLRQITGRWQRHRANQIPSLQRLQHRFTRCQDGQRHRVSGQVSGQYDL